MNSLPNEILIYLSGYIDRSTLVSLRLVCRRFHSLFKRKRTNYRKLYISQCCKDGHYDLFMLARGWHQPLRHCCYQAIVGGSLQIFKEVTNGDDSKFHYYDQLIYYNRKAMFALIYKGEKLPSGAWFCGHDWIKPYLKEKRTRMISRDLFLVRDEQQLLQALQETGLDFHWRLVLRREQYEFVVRMYPNHSGVNEKCLLKHGSVELLKFVMSKRALNANVCLTCAVCYNRTDCLLYLIRCYYAKEVTLPSDICATFDLIRSLDPKFTPIPSIVTYAIYMRNLNLLQYIKLYYPEYLTHPDRHRYVTNSAYPASKDFLDFCYNTFGKDVINNQWTTITPEIHTWLKEHNFESDYHYYNKETWKLVIPEVKCVTRRHLDNIHDPELLDLCFPKLKQGKVFTSIELFKTRWLYQKGILDINHTSPDILEWCQY